MAKGNDGNLLQHAMEVSIAEKLVDGHDGGLFVVLTHAMAPVEEFEPLRPNPRPYKLLQRWMEEAEYRNRPIERLPSIIRVYRETRASRRAYPNSARILSLAQGAKPISGHLFEINGGKAGLLRKEWQGSGLAVHEESWRQMDRHVAFGEVRSPWLLSMDPNTYVERLLAGSEDFCICEDDLKRVAALVAEPLAEARPGALLISCYGLSPERRKEFAAAVARYFLADASHLSHAFVETAAGGGNRHMCAIVSNSAEAVEGAVADWSRLKKPD